MKALSEAATGVLALGAKIQLVLSEIDDLLDIDPLAWAGSGSLSDADLGILDERAQRAIHAPSHLAEQCMILALEQEARANGLSAVIDAWIFNDTAYVGISQAVESIWHRSAAEALVKNDPALATHAGQAHEEIRRRYAELDRQILEKNRQFLAGKLSRRPVKAHGSALRGTGPAGRSSNINAVCSDPQCIFAIFSRSPATPSARLHPAS